MEDATMSPENRDKLRVLSRILLRCGLLSFLLLFLWLGVLMFARPLIHQLHGSMFGLSAHELNVILYGAMGLLKLQALTLFWIPWIAIQMVLRSEGAK